MEKQTITKLNSSFEESAYEQDGVEYWLARELQELLGYADWRNFLNAVDKAKESCKTSGEADSNHFVDVTKTIPMPKGASKDVPDMMLTRYACYLIAQNGDPKKEQIAFAQSYFAIQTRKQELLEERIKLMEPLQAREKLAAAETELSKNIYERGVDNKGFANIRSKGDWALFGGNNSPDLIDLPDFKNQGNQDNHKNQGSDKMKQGWEVKKLGEVIEIRNGKNQQAVLSETGQYPILGSGGNVNIAKPHEPTLKPKLAKECVCPNARHTETK